MIGAWLFEIHTYDQSKRVNVINKNTSKIMWKKNKKQNPTFTLLSFSKNKSWTKKATWDKTTKSSSIHPSLFIFKQWYMLLLSFFWKFNRKSHQIWFCVCVCACACVYPNIYIWWMGGKVRFVIGKEGSVTQSWKLHFNDVNSLQK